MRNSVINDEAARNILIAAGITVDRRLPAIARKLDEIARAVITAAFVRREGERSRQRVMMGAAIRRQLFGDLNGLWMRLTRIVPGVTYSPGTGTVGGRYVRFVQTFCGTVVDHVVNETGGKPAPHWHGLLQNLRSIQRNGDLVREGIELTGIRRILTDESKRKGIRSTSFESAVLDALRSAPADVAAIAQKLGSDRKKVSAAIQRLKRAGKVKAKRSIRREGPARARQERMREERREQARLWLKNAASKRRE